jgi:hypothetical protein
MPKLTHEPIKLMVKAKTKTILTKALFDKKRD